MKSKRNFKLVAIVLAFCMVVTSVLSPIGFSRADSVNVAYYEDWDFYGKSAPEPVTLYCEADSISFYATCEGDTPDVLTCYIRDMNGSDFAVSFDFIADGSVTTIPVHFNTSQYKIFVTGNANIKKTDLLVVFSEFN